MPKTLEWEKTGRGLYGRDTTGRWDGDEAGNEWTCGYLVKADPEEGGFAVYEDDGRGNGNLVGRAPTEEEGKEVAEQDNQTWVRDLDNANGQKRGGA